MKKKIISFILVVMAIGVSLIFTNSTKVFAEENVTYISLSDEGVKVNEEDISTDTTSNVYLTNKTNNGSSGKEALEVNVDIANIININKSGIYEFTGSISDGQIAINANTIDGDVTIILNNANITCENAPVVFVYNTNEKLLDKTLTIKTTAGTTNSLTGARIKESVLDWENQDEIVYYIEKGYDDEDHTYYEKYKYNGAISSDISLIFEGEGTLEITSTKKEGIETRGNVTINSGKYIIKAQDDGINACTDNESVITINGGEVLVDVSDAEEGDGIDSNGYLYINGGTVCSFASETSQDSGLDADLGIYINGGNVVATGSMSDAVSSESKQEYLQLQFSNEIKEGTILIITEGNNSLIAFDTDNNYTNLTISSPKFNGQEYSIYEAENIEGTEVNGLYTEITSYEAGTLREDWNNTGNRDFNKMINKDFDKNNKEQKENNSDNVYYYVLIVLVVLLIIFVAIAIISKKKGTNKMNGKILTFIIGMLVGAIITTTAFIIYNKFNEDEEPEQNKMNQEQMMEMRGNRERPTETMPEGEIPTGEKPEENMQNLPTTVTNENNKSL